MRACVAYALLVGFGVPVPRWRYPNSTTAFLIFTFLCVFLPSTKPKLEDKLAGEIAIEAHERQADACRCYCNDKAGALVIRTIWMFNCGGVYIFGINIFQHFRLFDCCCLCALKLNVLQATMLNLESTRSTGGPDIFCNGSSPRPPPVLRFMLMMDERLQCK